SCRSGILSANGAFFFEEFDDSVVTESSCCIQGGAAIGIFCIEVGARFDGDLHGFEHQSFLCIAVDRNPFVAAAHAGGGQEDGRDIETMSKDVVRRISAVRNVIRTKDKLWIGAMLQEKTHHL